MKNRSSLSSIDSNATTVSSRRTVRTAKSIDGSDLEAGPALANARAIDREACSHQSQQQFSVDSIIQFNNNTTLGGTMVESTTTQTMVQVGGWTGGLTKEWLMTDLIFIRHPRTILILAAINLCLSIQIIVFGLICRFYEGCPYASGVWIGSLFVANSIFGFIFLKFKPKRLFLIIYCFNSIICLLLAVFLFAWTAWMLDNEEYLMKKKGWNFIRPRAYGLNQIIENTKLAMFVLHMVLAPIYGVCCIGTIIILCQNLAAPSSEEFHGYYISNAPCGHQTVLVPVALKTGVKESPIYTRVKTPPKIFVNDKSEDFEQVMGHRRRLVSAGTQTVVTGKYM